MRKKNLSPTPRPLALILLLWSTLFASNLSAQVVQPEQVEIQKPESSQEIPKRSKNNFMGSVSYNRIGVDLNSSSTFPNGEYAVPLMGPTVQLGTNIKNEKGEPIWFIVELGMARNQDNTTKTHLKSVTILNIGYEYPVLYILDGKQAQLTLDYGLFASMCSLRGTDSNSLSKWGLAARSILAFRQKSQKGVSFGVKFYNLLGRYFGKNKVDSPLRFSYTNEFGIGAMIYF